jgi:outer membrane protein assembly factor BamB
MAKGELIVNSNWMTRLDYEPVDVRYHETGNVLVVRVPGDAPIGPAVELIDAQTGAVFGTIQTDGRPHSSEFVKEEELLIVSTRDHLYVIEPYSAIIRWETQARQIGHITEEFAYLYSDATMWARNLTSGTERWEHVLPDSIRGVQMLSGTLIVIVDKGLIAVDPPSGDENWYYRPEDMSGFTITDCGIVTTFNSDERRRDVARIDERTGAEQWSFSCASPQLSRTVFVDEQSIFIREHSNGTVAAIDRVSGTLNWRSEEYSCCKDIWLGESALYVDGEGKISDDFKHEFHAVDLQTGRTKWRVEINQGVSTFDKDSVPEDIYVWTKSSSGDKEGTGTVYAITQRTGSLQWQYDLRDDYVKDIHPGTNSVIARAGNTVYTLDSTDGQPLWSLAGEDYVSIRSVTEQRVVVQVDSEIHVLNRDHGGLEGRFDSGGGLEQSINSGVTGGGALFVFDNRDLKAYPVADSPEAFQQGTDQEGSTQTEVFTEGPGLVEETETPDGTQVFESATASDEPARGEDSPTIAFCPSCGSDLSEFGGVAFCPSCGAELPTSGE